MTGVDPHAWWAGLPQERRTELDRIAQRSPLGLERYPFWSVEVCTEIVAWQELENDVLRAHRDWLTATKAYFESRGVEWTVDNLNAYSRLWGHE